MGSLSPVLIGGRFFNLMPGLLMPWPKSFQVALYLSELIPVLSYGN
jgi:hypothetical protein